MIKYLHYILVPICIAFLLLLATAAIYGYWQFVFENVFMRVEK
jgi:hypothetical protein